jgi:hypothetical protein
MPVGFPDYYGGLTLPVTVQEGGTGQTSITSKAMLYGAGTSQLIETNVGSSGQVLQINSVTLVPTFQALTGTALTPPLQLTPYQQDALLVGDSSDLPAARGAFEIAAPSGSIVNPIIVSIATVQLLNLSPAGNLIIAGALTLGSPLAVAQGGNGTASPALTAGNGISLSGSWPGYTITNAQFSYFSAGILAIAHGGTATASPALTAGSNITITGTWPNNTIALTAQPTFGTTGTSTTDFNLAALTGFNQAQFSRDTTSLPVAGVNREMLGIANSGVAFILALDHSGNLGLAGTLKLGTVLAVTYGGSGSSSPSLVAGSGISITGSWPNQTVAISGGGTVPIIVATVNLTTQTASIGATTLYTPAGAGLYRITIEAIVKSTTGTSTLSVNILHTQNSQSFNNGVLVTLSASAGYATKGVLWAVYADASTAIQYTSTWSSGGAGDSYDLHIRVEAI